MIEEALKKNRVIPAVTIDDAEDAVPLCAALKAGGLEAAEFTFRTPAAPAAIAHVAREFPEFLIGAGTVTTVDEAQAAHDAGAQFAVAPGMNPKVVLKAREIGLAFIPGVCTPSEVDASLELGCRVLKFFPVNLLGGVKAIKAVYAPYAHRGVRFVPAGGITPENMGEFLAHPGVVAVVGSWLTPRDVLEAKDWGRVTELAREAMAKARCE